METVFISAALLLASLFLVSNSMVQGIGGMASSLRQVGMFLLNKAPVGLIDLFNDKPGSGTKTWLRFGMAWFFMACLGMFLGIWHRYDPTALNSLSSIGWSYDDGSMLTDYTAIFFSTALNYLLVGAALVAISRASKGRLASEASASMVAVLLTVSTIVVLLLPAIFSFITIGNEASVLETLQNISMLVVGAMLHFALLINVFITLGDREHNDISPTTWFLVLALVAKIMAMLFVFFGELVDSTQTVWMAERVLTGWVPLALIFAVAYHIIPFTTGKPIWSESMQKISMLFLFITIPPFFVSSADAGELLQNVGAILMTLGLLPLLAGSFNMVATAASNPEKIIKSPGAFAATAAMLLIPIYAIGGFFTGMDTFVGMDKLGSMAHTVDTGFISTVGSLMMLAAIFTSYPLAAGKKLAKASNAQLAVWLTLVGGVASTIAALMGDFTAYAVTNSGVEDAVASTEGFFLVSAAMFYMVTMASILAALSMIHTGRPNNASYSDMSVQSDIDSYTLVDGSTTIRTLLGRGVGVDTTLHIGEIQEDEGGSSIIQVSTQLHNDEVTEFPVPEELVMLAQFLKQTKQSIFEFFNTIDLDGSGEIDGYEFQQALAKSNIANLPPWEMSRLVSAVDLDGDGRINLPELDIMLAKIRTEILESEEE
ncbi:MAG: EF-hand domain-containing protein [Candidatus Poseidoniales archaeon]